MFRGLAIFILVGWFLLNDTRTCTARNVLLAVLPETGSPKRAKNFHRNDSWAEISQENVDITHGGGEEHQLPLRTICHEG